MENGHNYNNYNYYNNGAYRQPDRQKGKGGFAIASFVLGLTAMLSCGCGPGAIALYAANLWSLGAAVAAFLVGGFAALVVGIAGLVFGIISCARRAQKQGMAVAGIITSAICLLLSMIMWIVIFRDYSPNDSVEQYMDAIAKGQENSVFNDKYFELDDGSCIYFYKDGNFYWYESDQNHTDNYYQGTYETKSGESGIDYIVDELPEYGVTAQEMEDYFLRVGDDDLYREKNFLYLELHTELQHIGGKEENNDRISRYMGFYAEGVYDAANMDSSSYVLFVEQ